MKQIITMELRIIMIVYILSSASKVGFMLDKLIEKLSICIQFEKNLYFSRYFCANTRDIFFFTTWSMCKRTIAQGESIIAHNSIQTR